MGLCGSAPAPVSPVGLKNSARRRTESIHGSKKVLFKKIRQVRQNLVANLANRPERMIRRNSLLR